MPNLTFLDSTLRDGAQSEDISFSLQDKLGIASALDEFGVDFIEAGIPGANPKDIEFFHQAAKLSFSHAKICAFGSTRHKGIPACEDDSLNAILAAETPVAVIFGKASQKHVEHILRVSQQENLDMITDSIDFLRSHGKSVIYDAEHFFDGYAANPDFAMKTLQAAIQAGAMSVTLCDTNGATTPTALRQAFENVIAKFPGFAFGIHCHNDIGCAVANSMLAVEAGATMVQGTFSGIGERCGNADLSILIPNLILKKGCSCQIAEIGSLASLCSAATRIAEISNIAIPGSKPYIGKSAFTHKGGMHTDGVIKDSTTFEHVTPELIGNHRRFLMSEVAGRSTLVEKLKRFPSFSHSSIALTKDSPEIQCILSELKKREFNGYQFEAADASLELLTRRTLGMHSPHFKLIQYRTTGEFPSPTEGEQCHAMIQVEVGGNTEITAALGDGPVHALDTALRKALHVFYPQLANVQLTDYKVRVIDSDSATAAKVRVLIESSDGINTWNTVGVSTDIIEASWIALQDSIEYKLDVLTPSAH